MDTPHYCWNSKHANHDSGSESAPLLSSESQTSTEPVIFPDSETSDLDLSPSNAQARYGTVQKTGPHSAISALPKRLTYLAQENILFEPISRSFSTPLLISPQERRYDIHNIDPVVDTEKYEIRSTYKPKETIGKKHFKKYSRGEDTQNSHKVSKSNQSSLVTIFSIWNTILGSSLLTMPWGIGMAGFFPGIILILLMSGICLYTARCLLLVHKYHGGHEEIEVVQLCRVFLNKWAEYIARIFSIAVLIGATIAYWVLMSNFLYNSVNFIYDDIIGVFQSAEDNNATELLPEVLCEKKTIFNSTNAGMVHDRSLSPLGPVWDLYKTVPIFLGILIFPFLNVKSPTFFTKFNSLGTISIVYLICFVIVKSVTWGVNMNANDWQNAWIWQPSFPALSGMLALSFFIHNIIISIMKNNRDQSKNGRDLGIAYVLVTITYIIIGFTFYACFPLAKSCIEDNFLNNFQKSDGLTVGARVLLLFQLLTVYPLLAYMLRIQLLSSICQTFNRGWVILVNILLVSVCILFATFVPYVGTIIRYTGAFSGLIYVFTLPSLLYLAIMRKQGKLTWFKLLLHISIPVIGTANLLAQFFINDR